MELAEFVPKWNCAYGRWVVRRGVRRLAVSPLQTPVKPSRVGLSRSHLASFCRPTGDSEAAWSVGGPARTLPQRRTTTVPHCIAAAADATEILIENV